MPKILALSIRPKEGADTRYRMLQFIDLFRDRGLEIEHHSLLSAEFYAEQKKGLLGLSGPLRLALFLRRWWPIIAKADRYDGVWVSRELFPIGPPFLERKLFSKNKRVILDIDDALFCPDHAGGRVHRLSRDFKKYEYIAPRCAAIVCGNNFLDQYFRQFNDNTRIIPTCVKAADYRHIHREPDPAGRLRIGWIGVPFNRMHLEAVRRPVEELARQYDISMTTVGLESPLDWRMPHVGNRHWRLDHELDYFKTFDIGIMPLYDSPFTRGKCAFKLIQYMAAGIPVIASPVGSNVEAVTDGEQGFLADGDQQWRQALEALITDRALREKMGRAGRERVLRRYSLEAHWSNYADILLGEQ